MPFNKKYKEKIKKLESEISKLKAKPNQVKKDYEKAILQIKKYQNVDDIIDFEIKLDDWELVEKKMHKTGILLEHEIAKILDEMGITYKTSEKFYYPKERGSFYIDYFFKNTSEDLENVDIGEFETDLKAVDQLNLNDDNFDINIYVNYFIECKSKNLVNYIIIPENTKKPSKFSFQSNAFKGFFLIESKSFVRTTNKIIGINYPKFNIEKDTFNIFKKAFWQLFNRIDYQSNHQLEFKIFNYFSYRTYPLPLDIISSYPDNYNQFNTIYEEIIKQNRVPEEINDKIKLNMEVYVPIIVVNGHLYSLNLDPKVNENFEKKAKKIYGFVKTFDQIKYGDDSRIRFHSLLRFIMQYLSENKICFSDDIFFPKIGSIFPILDVLVISSPKFKQLFKHIRKLILSNIENYMRIYMDDIFIERIEELRRFHILCWFMARNHKWMDDLKLDCLLVYKEKIKSLEYLEFSEGLFLP